MALDVFPCPCHLAASASLPGIEAAFCRLCHLTYNLPTIALSQKKSLTVTFGHQRCTLEQPYLPEPLYFGQCVFSWLSHVKVLMYGICLKAQIFFALL